MPKINILPKEVYNLIAAGEVVERPMSVVKEMIENSIDAGSKNITIEIKNGGITFIRITDDGCGISREDVKKVFIPHATSKIATSEDLAAIGTLGFRGEAMASISAVSKVELFTKTHEEPFGTRYEINGGEEVTLEEAGCPEGTTIIVRDIFFNVPARMKFLKKDVTEGNSIQGIVDRIALSHPEISFRFIRDGKQVLLTSGNGELKSTIYSLFGSEFSKTLMEVSYEYQGMKLTGFTSTPHDSRKSRAMQFFFINGRLVKSATAMAALEQAYKNVIMVGKFPACVINIEMDLSKVDVNVHPAKIEVRFSNEKDIFDLIYYGIKTAIETKDTVKNAEFYQTMDGRKYKNLEKQVDKIDFGVKPEPPIQLKINTSNIQRSEEVTHIRRDSYGSISEYQLKAQSSFNDNDNVKEKSYATVVSVDFGNEDKEMPNSIDISEKPKEAEVQELIPEKEELPSFRVVGEAFKTYIIVEIENDLYYIDKHAAHERMNFENLKKDANENGIASQMLLSPVVVKLALDEYSLVIESAALLKKCGFECEDFGNSSVIVREIPSMLNGCDIKDLFVEIAGKLLEHKTDVEPEKMDWIFHSTSCRAAVKGGNYTSPEERELFVKKLLSNPDIRYCPHGRPVMVKMTKYEIEKQFGRIQ